MNYPQTGKALYHRSFPTGLKLLSPMSEFSAWGSGNRRRSPERTCLCLPVGFDHRNSTGLGETETLVLKDAHKVSVHLNPELGWVDSELIREWAKQTC